VLADEFSPKPFSTFRNATKKTKKNLPHSLCFGELQFSPHLTLKVGEEEEEKKTLKKSLISDTLLFSLFGGNWLFKASWVAGG
jgi:hypothetical protein